MKATDQPIEPTTSDLIALAKLQLDAYQRTLKEELNDLHNLILNTHTELFTDN